MSTEQSIDELNGHFYLEKKVRKKNLKGRWYDPTRVTLVGCINGGSKLKAIQEIGRTCTKLPPDKEKAPS